MVDRIGGGALHAVFDDDKRSVFSHPVIGALLIGHGRANQSLGEVELFAGSHDDIGLFCNNGIIDGNIVLRLPVVFPIIDIKDEGNVVFPGKHGGLDGGFSGRAFGKRGARNEKSVRTCNIILVNIFYA